MVLKALLELTKGLLRTVAKSLYSRWHAAKNKTEFKTLTYPDQRAATPDVPKHHCKMLYEPFLLSLVENRQVSMASRSWSIPLIAPCPVADGPS